VLSTPYTINKTEAFNEWGRQVTIVVLPLLFCLNPLDLKKYRSDFFITFILVCTATIIYLYADAVVTIRHYGLPYHALFSAAFTNHNFSEPIDIHATFFSMLVAIALVFTISLMLTQKTPFINLLLFISAFILSAGLIQLGSKSVCIALLFIINIAIPWFLLNGIPRWRFIMLSAMVSVLLMILIMSQHDLKNRFAGELKSDLSSNPSTTIFDSRLARWRSAMQLIKQAPLTGHGAGSEITLLHDEYYKNGLYNSFVNHLNTHNEYLSFLIKSGIVGLLIYLATLAYGFSIAFKNKDLLFFRIYWMWIRVFVFMPYSFRCLFLWMNASQMPKIRLKKAGNYLLKGRRFFLLYKIFVARLSARGNLIVSSNVIIMNLHLTNE
jgi:O-antigen ligase